MNSRYLFILCWLCVIYSCDKTNINAPKRVGSKPDPVSQYQVTSLNGGAKIEFKMPASEDLLYVKAVYKLSNGHRYEVISSLYKNYLIVDGFSKEGEYDVTLYAVAQGGTLSEPVHVKIKVLTPAYLATRNSIVLTPTFGGVNVSFINEIKGDLSIKLMYKDANSNWTESQTYYTNSESGNFSVRGFTPKPEVTETTFGVYVQDKWGNISDTLIKSILPVYEMPIPKTSWKKFVLPGDQPDPHPQYPQWSLEKLWDNSLGLNNVFHSPSVVDYWPLYFTIDLGIIVNLSRVRMHQRQTQQYNANNVKLFELYGSMSPNLDGSFDESWTKLGTFEVKKPSGSPVGTNTAEDLTVSQNGHDFDFASNIKDIRYIRVRVLESWTGSPSVTIGEFSLWGQVK